MTTIDFEETICLRIKTVQRKQIKKIIKKNIDKYYNESHFVRCAINKLIARESGDDVIDLQNYLRGRTK